MSQKLLQVSLVQESSREKWHVAVFQMNSLAEYAQVSDSESPEFPVNVDTYGTLQKDLLLQDLRSYFPQAEIHAVLP